MEDQIAAALRPLIDLPLSMVYRSAGLAVIHFGEMRSVTNRLGTGAVGAYAIHLQCAWRIIGPAGMVVGWSDRVLAPGDDPDKNGDAFDWEVPAITRFDERIAAFLKERADDLPIVKRIRVGAVGSFSLDMTGDTTVEVFPATSVGEHWRIFRPSERGNHFVLTAEGIEES